MNESNTASLKTAVLMSTALVMALAANNAQSNGFEDDREDDPPGTVYVTGEQWNGILDAPQGLSALSYPT